MQGTAVKMFHLSNLNIYNNNFTENGPVTSFSEIEYSPYYKYLALGQRTMTISEAGCSINSTYTNEFDYAQNCFNPSYYVDMPPTHGALYIEHCYDRVECQYAFTLAELQRLQDIQYFTNKLSREDQIAQFGEVIQFFVSRDVIKPIQYAVIHKNRFQNNQVLPILLWQ